MIKPTSSSDQPNMEQPPLIPAEPAADRKPPVGRIGLYLSLAPLAALAVLQLFNPG